MKQWLVGLFCVLMACVAAANDLSAVRQRAEASMLITGTVVVKPDGSVGSYAIDRADKLPPVVIQVIRQNVPDWKFQFEDKQAAAVKASMSLRIIARRIDDQHDSVSISAAQFAEEHQAPGETISYKTRAQPVYPQESLDAGATGTVYLLLRVGRDGLVKDAAAQQVNLTVYASDRKMKSLRNDLAKAALKAARRWTFNIPTTGKHVADNYWLASIPVNFSINNMGIERRYGNWQGYIPGPHELIPWLSDKKLFTQAADAIPDDSIYQINQDLQLATPLSGT